MAALLTIKLPVFVQSLASDPFIYGETDCLMTLANWVRFVTGNDPAVHLRGQYHDEAGWRAIVSDAGGMVLLVDTIASRAGLVRADGEPVVGDVAIVDSKIGEVGGVRLERGWAVKLNRSLTRIRAPAIALWRLL